MDQINLDAIRNAQKRISKIVSETPVKESAYFSELTGLSTWLKLENLNVSGSFKIRGSSNAILSLDKNSLKNGIVATSAGNHAQGVARTCRDLGVPATVFMPVNTPMVKAEATRSLGAHVVLRGETYDDAYQHATEFLKTNGGKLIHPFNDPAVINGQGTVGLEILDQLDDVGMIVVPVGGGGLISGIAVAVKSIKPDILVLGVQSEHFPSMKKSFDAGNPLDEGSGPTISDGIAVKKCDPYNYALIKKHVDGFVLASEDATAAAIMALMERDHLLTEGAGAIGVAGLIGLSDQWRQKIGSKKVVCVLGGGNIDINLLERISKRGLIYTGRLMKIRFRLIDRPKALGSLLENMGKIGVNIRKVEHQRTFLNAGFKDVEVDIDIETNNRQHQLDLKDSLLNGGFSFDVLWEANKDL